MPEMSFIPVADPLAELPPVDPEGEHASGWMKAATFLTIVVPFIVLIILPFVVWGWGITWIDVGLLLLFYVLTTLGVTVGFHRLFTHASFDAPTWVKAIFAVLGSLSVQGSLIQWVALHRRHHQHSDKATDPHSPHHHGSGVLGILKGLWHAHVGWMFEPNPANLERYVPDLRKNKTLSRISDLFPLWVVLTLLLPAAIGGLLSGSWMGALTGFIWGGPVRLFLVHHVTWSVNSACHIWGQQTFNSNDQSRNNFVFGVLAMGEGWHNTHHAFPSSARHGLRWWQFDASYWVIRTLKSFGLAWNVKVPDRKAQALKKRMRAAAAPKP